MKLPLAVTTERFTERTRSLLTLVNFHYAGVALLAVVNLFMAAQMYVAWRAQSTQGTEALAQQKALMQVAELQAKPLEGLDAKLATATSSSDLFYERRLPYAHSQFLTELGILTKRTGAKLGRVQYGEAPVLDGDGGALTEVRMDASLSGDYRSLVQFVNAVERDRMFFVIRAVSLSGQQSGTVGLRLGLTTYLRAAGPGEMAEKASVTTRGYRDEWRLGREPCFGRSRAMTEQQQKIAAGSLFAVFAGVILWWQLSSTAGAPVPPPAPVVTTVTASSAGSVPGIGQFEFTSERGGDEAYRDDTGGARSDASDGADARHGVAGVLG